MGNVPLFVLKLIFPTAPVISDTHTKLDGFKSAFKYMQKVVFKDPPYKLTVQAEWSETTEQNN